MGPRDTRTRSAHSARDFASAVLLALGLGISAAGAQATVTPLPSPNPGPPEGRLAAGGARLAGDGDDLLVAYCEGQFWPTEGDITVVKRWSGTGWVDQGCDVYSTYGSECHVVDVDVAGGLYSVVWTNDGGGLSWASNYDGTCSGSGYMATPWQRQHSVDAAVALGRPYRGYAEYTSASTYAVVDFFAAPGPAPAYYSDCPGNDPASDPELDGTSDAWYLAYRCAAFDNCLFTARGFYASPGQPADEPLGPCFLGDTETVSISDLVVFGGRPVVLWTAKGPSVAAETVVYAARYEPALSPIPWDLIGVWLPQSGSEFVLAQGAVAGSRLHVALNERRISTGSSRILLDAWNGTSWTGPALVASGADLRGVDVAGFHGVPIVSWADPSAPAAGTIRVAAVEIPEPGAVASDAAALLGMAVSRRLRRVRPDRARA
jgi:hypothetical protein